MAVHELSRADARRIAVRAQLLAQPRPTGLLEVVRHLGMLQIDETVAVAPSADLVLWGRLGSSYEPGELRELLDDRTLVDLRGMIRPSEDIALYRADMAAWDCAVPGEPAWRASHRKWVRANDAFRKEILHRLTVDGPVPASDLPNRCAVPWSSTGWNNDRSRRQMLEFMVLRGEAAVAGRDGRERLWDLAERVYPDDPPVPVEQARRAREERRLRALGIARSRAAECPVERMDVGEAGEPAVIEGVRGQWRVDPAQLGQRFAGRVALLSPLDRLVYDRKRMVELFEFDYQLEMYKPAAKRRWGYYALPILSGDRLVGKVDATADRRGHVLRVDAIHRDEPFSAALTAKVRREIKELAAWLRLDLDLPA